MSRAASRKDDIALIIHPKLAPYEEVGHDALGVHEELHAVFALNGIAAEVVYSFE